MRRDAEFFEGRDLELFYIAKRLNEALALEQLLTESGFEYLVEPDRYRGGFLFQTERVGAFFYAASESLDAVRDLLTAHGYRPHAAR